MSETFHTSLLYQSPIPILMLDGINLSVQVVNSAFLELSGFEETEITGTKPPFLWEASGDGPSCFCVERLKRSCCESVVKEKRTFWTKERKSFDVELTVSSIKSDVGKISFLITMMERTSEESLKNNPGESRAVELEKANAVLQLELAERLKREKYLNEQVRLKTEQLEHSRSFWEKLFQESPEGIVLLDEHDHVIEVNRSFCDMFGYDGDGIRGQIINNLVGKDAGIQIDVERMARKLFNEDSLAYDAYRTRNDGSLIPVYIHASSFDLGGKKYAYCSYGDISARKRNEEKLKYHAKMQSLMVKVAYRFIFPSDKINSHIFKAIEDMAHFFKCSLATLIQFNEKGVMSRCVRWHKEGQPHTSDSFFKSLTVKKISWLWERLSNNDIVMWDDLDSIKVPNEEERRLFRKVLGDQSAVFYPLITKGVLSGVVGMCRDKSFSVDSIRIADFYVFCSIISGAIERYENERTLKNNYKILNKTFENTIKTMGDMLRVRDPYTAAHQKRVAVLAEEIGSQLGLGDDSLNGLRIASLVHDVGKIKVPTEILNKPGLLSSLEFEIIKEHPQLGKNILSNIDFPWPVATIVAQHHERMDGSGYPEGLWGDQILMESRVLAVADVVEAMSSHRPYRPGLGLDVALDDIRRGRGVLYDQKVVDACLDFLDGKENLDFIEKY